MTGLLVFTLAAVGCASTSLQKFNLTVSLDPAYMQKTGGVVTKVDVVALGGEQAKTLDSVVMSGYWGNPWRQQLLNDQMVWTVELSPTADAATLRASDKLWTKSWKTGDQLFILADITGVGPKADGSDPRRLKLPRQSDRWDTKALSVKVNAFGLTYSPPEKSAAQ